MEVSQILAMNLEIVPEDEHDPDPAAIHAFASSAITTLQQEPEKYQIQSSSDGQRGGLVLLFQLVIQGVQTLDAAVLAQKDSIDALSGLCTIFTTISAPLLILFKAHHKKTPSEPQHAISIRVKIDDAEIEVTSHDIADDEHIVQLAKRFITQHPQAKPTSKSKLSAQARVPKQRPRPKR